MGKAYKTPTLDYFIESLIHEKHKLIIMGTLNDSKAHALVVHEWGKSSSKSNQ